MKRTSESECERSITAQYKNVNNYPSIKECFQYERWIRVAT